VTLTERQRREVDSILEKKSERSGGVITVRSDDQIKFQSGTAVLVILDAFGEYVENPKSALVLACYEQLGSVFGDYPELYIIEYADGKIDNRVTANVMIRKEDVHGY